MKFVWIYVLKDNGVIFYVGQTIRIYLRLEQHIQTAKKLTSVIDKRIMDIINNNRELTIEVLTGCNNINSFAIERATVEQLINEGIELINKRYAVNRKQPVNYGRNRK